MKKLLLLLPLLTLTLHFAYFKRTKGFCLKKINSTYAYQPEWDTGPPTPTQQTLLKELSKQTFSYLGSGKECYAFSSEDGKYVLKFFKQKHMKNTHILKNVPFFREKIDKKTTRRHTLRTKTFTSYLLSYHTLPEETGVVYLHLTPSKDLNLNYHFRDHKKRPFSLPLDEMEFLIQKKAIPSFDKIHQLMQKQQIRETELALDSIMQLIQKRRAKNIADHDLNCEKNLGFIGLQAIEIDLGEFTLASTLPTLKEEVFEATKDLSTFLQIHYPPLAAYLTKQIENLP